jgi:hypothetical protein
VARPLLDSSLMKLGRRLRKGAAAFCVSERRNLLYRRGYTGALGLAALHLGFAALGGVAWVIFDAFTGALTACLMAGALAFLRLAFKDH